MTTTLDVVSNITCTGAADGSVDFSFDNYDATATAVNYEIFNAQSNTTTGISGTETVNPPTGAISVTNLGPLPQGIYYILLNEVGGVYDGCSVSTLDFTITESSNLLQVTAASPTNDNCNPNQGVITAVAQFGTAPYEFQYLLNTDPVPAATDPGWVTSTSSNVESGNYIVYVKDANNCIQSDAVTVLLDADPSISVAIIDECVAEGTFEVLVTLNNPAAASAPFSLSLNGGATQNITFNGSNQYTVSGVSSGLGQTIAVSDLNGCTDTQTFDIHPPLQFNANLSTLLDCEIAPANNAEITINVTAGSGTYDYEIDGPGAVDQTRTSLGGTTLTWTGASVAGSYMVTVYDTSTAAPNCSQSIVVDVPVVVSPDISVVAFDNVSCNGADDGTITVNTTDLGFGPYSFEIISGPGSSATFPLTPSSTTATTATFTGLEGTLGGINHTIRVTAGNSCTTDIVQTITQPNVISNINAAVVEFGCTTGNNPDNATVTVNTGGITGGSGNYVVYEFVDNATSAVLQSGSSNMYVETNFAERVLDINVYEGAHSFHRYWRSQIWYYMAGRLPSPAPRDFFTRKKGVGLF